MNEALKTFSLSKSYGHNLVVSNIELKVEWGQCLSIVGPNGSGKSTLIKLLGSLMTPTNGKVFIAGMDALRHAEKVHRIVGVVSHQSYLYDALTVEENLILYGKLFGLKDPYHAKETLLDSLGLSIYSDILVGSLSHGMKKRAAIARALLHGPWLLLLDEPETGLDQQATEMLRQIITSHCSNGGTIIMTSHNFDTVLELSDSIAILSSGKMAYYGSRGGFDKKSLQQIYFNKTGLSN